MKIPWLSQLLAVVAPLALLCAWAVVIWVALHVSTIVLNTLDMIVELAAISP
jgi:hypothetical protein